MIFVFILYIKYCILIQFAGENKYGATISVVVTITKKTFKTDLDIVSVTPDKVSHEMQYLVHRLTINNMKAFKLTSIAPFILGVCFPRKY